MTGKVLYIYTDCLTKFPLLISSKHDHVMLNLGENLNKLDLSLKHILTQMTPSQEIYMIL